MFFQVIFLEKTTIMGY